MQIIMITNSNHNKEHKINTKKNILITTQNNTKLITIFFLLQKKKKNLTYKNKINFLIITIGNSQTKRTTTTDSQPSYTG